MIIYLKLGSIYGKLLHPPNSIAALIQQQFYKMEADSHSQASPTRCRICLQSSSPLLALCACAGTIGFVHEKCIIKWISRKLEDSQNFVVPNCQICRIPYSAQLHLGEQKISFTQVLKRLRQTLSLLEAIVFIVIIIGCLAAPIILFQAFVGLMSAQLPNIIYFAFGMVIFPISFINMGIKKIQTKKQILTESRVQLVQITLVPRQILH